MIEDKTQILLKKALRGTDLTEDEADIVAQRNQDNSDSIERFEALEVEIDKVRTAAKWLGGLLLANYSSNILDWLTR